MVRRAVLGALVCFVLGGVAFAGGDAPPLDKKIQREVDRIERFLGQAEKKIATGKAKYAKSNVASAERTWKKLLERNKDTLDENHPALVKVREHLEAVKKSLGGAQAADKLKLSPVVKSDLARITRALSVNPERVGHSILARAIDKAERLLAAALEKHKAVLNEKHAAVVAIRKKIAAFKGATATAGAREGLAAGWIAKFKPYLKNAPTMLAPGTSKEGWTIIERLLGGENAAETKRRVTVYQAAKKLFGEYKAASFPDGKTGDLQKVEQAMASRLARFEASCAETIDYRVTRIDRTIKDGEAQLAAGLAAAKKHPKKLPTWVGRVNVVRGQAKPIGELEAVAPLLGNLAPDASARIAQLKARVAAVVAGDKKLCEIRAQRNALGAELYKGADAADLKKLILAKIKEFHPECEVVRISLISTNWETVTELRGGTYYTYQQMEAEAAVRTPDKPFRWRGHEFAGDCVVRTFFDLWKTASTPAKTKWRLGLTDSQIMAAGNVGR